MSSAILRSRQLLADCIEAKGISERELARRAGLGHATVTHLTSGIRDRCQNMTARAIELALGVERGTLFMDTVTGR